MAHIEHEHQEAYKENRDIYEAVLRLQPDGEDKMFHVAEEATNNNIVENGESPGRRVNCLFCSLQFSSAEELCQHVPSHTDNKPFSCDICSRRFSIKAAMERHMKKHDSGVSSGGEYSEDEFDYQETATSSPGGGRSSPDKSGAAGAREREPAESKVTKRANLMDKINRLSAAKAEKEGPTLEQIFSSPTTNGD